MQYNQSCYSNNSNGGLTPFCSYNSNIYNNDSYYIKSGYINCSTMHLGSGLTYNSYNNSNTYSNNYSNFSNSSSSNSSSSNSSSSSSYIGYSAVLSGRQP
jgi:hypothetical protein